MEPRIAKMSKEGLEIVQKSEKKLSELGRDIILVAYEAEE